MCETIVFDFKWYILSSLKEAENEAREKIQKELKAKYEGHFVSFYVLVKNPNKASKEFKKITTLAYKVSLDKKGYGLNILNDKNRLFSVHPSRGIVLFDEVVAEE